MTPFIVMAFVAVAIVIRLLAGSIDSGRIEEYIQGRGGTLLEKNWDPFGPGCLGDNSSRIYEIKYRDAHGDVHRAHVKTSMLSGVYLTNDRVIEHAAGARSETRESAGDLLEENERLRRRIEELERERT